MPEGKRPVRGALALAAVTLMSVACGAPSRSAGTLADLDRWNASTTYSGNGRNITATYEGWPMSDVPFAFVCTKTPERVFDGQGLAINGDPNCSALASHLDGGTLTVSLDRAALPAAFANLDTWITVLATSTSEGTWSITSTMPSSFDNLP